MASLAALFPATNFSAGGAAGNFNTIYVYNTGVDTVNNGGFCCQFTVPSNTTWVRFEIWGAGSNGPGGCCCQQPRQSGGAGAYVRKTVGAVVGNTYTVCAGGSGCCTTSCCGSEGFPSYVCGGTLTGVVAACAAGGPTSCGGCFIGYSGCTMHANTETCRSGSYCGGDFGLPAISGAARSGTCGYQTWQYVPSGPYSGPGVRHSFDFCQALSGCQAIGGFATFPGGGGGGAQTNGGPTCWGSFGAGGLVIISYR